MSDNKSLINFELPDFIDNAGKNLTDAPTNLIGEAIRYRFYKWLRKGIIEGKELEMQDRIYLYQMEQKYMFINNDFQEELSKLSEEELCPPDPIIFDEILNSINENIDVQEIRSIYAKLLSASFIKSKKDKLSRELLSAVKQFSSYDAHVFNIFKEKSIVPIVNYKIILDNDYHDIMISINNDLFSIYANEEIVFKPLYLGDEIRRITLSNLIKYVYQNTNYRIKNDKSDIDDCIYNLKKYWERVTVFPKELYPAYNNISYELFDYKNNESIEHLDNVFKFDGEIEDAQPSSLERLSELKLLNISYNYKLNNNEYIDFYFSEPYNSYSKRFEKNFHYIEHGIANLTPLGNNLKSILFD